MCTSFLRRFMPVGWTALVERESYDPLISVGSAVVRYRLRVQDCNYTLRSLAVSYKTYHNLSKCAESETDRQHYSLRAQRVVRDIRVTMSRKRAYEAGVTHLESLHSAISMATERSQIETMIKNGNTILRKGLREASAEKMESVLEELTELLEESKESGEVLSSFSRQMSDSQDADMEDRIQNFIKSEMETISGFLPDEETEGEEEKVQGRTYAGPPRQLVAIPQI